MSMINAGAPYRRDQSSAQRIPVVMPVVKIAIDAEGFLSVALDGEPYSAERTLQRDDLQQLVDEVAADLGTPIRVELTEADGSTFTDIITPPPERGKDPASEHRVLASAFGISGEGFTAGEQVEVCVVVARQLADDGGTTHLRLPPALLASHPNVVLVGRSSRVVAASDGAA